MKSIVTTSCLTLLLSVFILGDAALAQVKTFQEINGFEIGERITENYQSIRYLEHADQASDRVSLIDLGFSWDKRPMKMAIVTSPANHARLDEIRENAHALNDPRVTSDAEAARIMENQPAIVYIGGSIHGFELSGSDAVLTLFEKLITENSPEVQHMLANTVVLIDPMINPDGRDAHAQHNHQRTGRVVNPERDDWNNDFTRWQALQFRTSHYFFDMNRDWFAQTHNEIRSRAAVIREWRPQVGVDAHEMGSDREFYFDPPTDPVAPFFPEHAKRWFTEFGNAYAEAFDDAGFEYITKELFNYFYPAYTTSFLSYQGAVGLLFEQGSTRGLAITRADGSVRTYADAIQQQFTASLATVKLSADRRQELLQSYYDDHKKAIEDGKTGYQRYFITNEGDPGLVRELVQILQRLGIEVGQLTEDTAIRGARDRYGKDAGRVTLPSGTYVVEAAQPRNRYIRTLLEPSVPVPDEFLKQARQRLDRGENPRFYDMTAWSLPLIFNLKAYSSGGRSVNASLVSEIDYEPEFPSQQPSYAYILNGNQTAAMSVLYTMRKKGYRVSMITKPTQIQGVSFSSGTVIFRTLVNGESLRNDLRKTAAHFGVDVKGVETGHGDGNFPSLGSTLSIPVTEPEIALLAEDPINALSFGFAWHKLDRQYEIDQTIIRVSSVGNTDLSRFNVIVLPEIYSSSMMNSMLGDAGKNRLKQWIRDGGTLVSIGEASEYVRKELELSNLGSFYDKEDNEDKARISVPGAFAQTVLDYENWLTSGFETAPPYLIFSSRLFTFPDGAPSGGRRMPLQAKSTDTFISGHVFEESVERVPGTALVYEERIGRGRVIMFSEDTNFRGYWRGLDRMFLNAVLLGPSAN